MCFSDTTQFNIPKPFIYANSDSSPFNSFPTKIHHKNPLYHPPTTSNYGFKIPSSNDSSSIKLHENSSFKTIIKTHQTDIPSDRLRHPSQNQTISPPPAIGRSTKTHYNLRHQPKMNYRFFIPTSKF